MQYTFICKTCGQRQEIHKPIGSNYTPRCAHCGGTMRRKYDPLTAHYRGGGFYATDKALDQTGDL